MQNIHEGIIPSERYLLRTGNVQLLVVIPLTKDNVVIGRCTNLHLKLSPHVSRRHAEMHKTKNGVWYIKDLNSSNGLYLNKEKIKPDIYFEVNDGDVIGFGVPHVKNETDFEFILCRKRYNTRQVKTRPILIPDPYYKLALQTKKHKVAKSKYKRIKLCNCDSGESINGSSTQEPLMKTRIKTVEKIDNEDNNDCKQFKIDKDLHIITSSNERNNVKTSYPSKRESSLRIATPLQNLDKLQINYSSSKTFNSESIKFISSDNKSQTTSLLSKEKNLNNRESENIEEFSVDKNTSENETRIPRGNKLYEENKNFYIPFLKSFETSRCYPNIVYNLESSKHFTEIIVDRIIAVILEWMRRKQTSKINFDYLMKVSLHYDSYEKYFNTYFQLLVLDLFEFINQSPDEYNNNQFDAIILETSVTELWCIKCKMLHKENFNVNDLVVFRVVSVSDNMENTYKFGIVTERFRYNNIENNYNNEYLIKILKQYDLVLTPGVGIRISFVCNITHFIQQCEALVWLRQSSFLKQIIKPDFECCKIQSATENPLVALNRYTSCQGNAVINISHTLVDSNNRCILMLQTPPGTGKCHTVTGIIQQILLQHDDKSKILVMCLSERSIEEIGQKLYDLNNENIRFVCIGKHQKNSKPFYLEETIERNLKKMSPTIVNFNYSGLVENLKNEIIINANVILATIDNLNSELMNFRKEFTCCIVYDSTQLTELQNLIPLQFGIEKLLLVGDPRRFSAPLLSKTAYEYGFHVSLFERFFNYFERSTDKSPVLMLWLQYLIHPDIIRFPSSYFYCNNLKSANVSNELSILPYCVLDLIDVKSQDSSTPEMKFIAELWDGLSNIIPEDKTVGVVTNYRHQRDTIRDILMDNAPNDEANYKILNTLLTRAKSSLILCGYFSIMSEYHFWDELIKDAKRRQILFRIPSSCSYFACEIIKTKKWILFSAV
ncbi:probable helicase senataxin isoform X2 [Centruroides sculpturatus]|uniref:probable helicase senataxin isoform X2 n=1 Tax=Centruroides sculpturatus TaxID=218467 RepID=UPI000C6EC15C|nr:probable helicase senataxin isoform X2 [Centruroides sculpturatus]